ncbi:MAG: diacylglycerol kinase family lipid kinase [Clostridia bacterium]|nr:diacylglycerol kinase family lipid kinase [Clostridia bacterium]
MRNLFFIVNKTAGSGRAAKNFAQIEAMLRDRQISYSYETTEYIGHGAELAKKAYKSGERCIIAVGGDGTAKEVGGALAGTDAVFGLLPFGTGNDLSRPLHIPDEPEKALDIILNGTVRPMDVGVANDKIFLNVSGFGFDVDVLENTDAFKKRFNGMIPYIFGIIKSLFSLKSTHITLTHDGETCSQESLLVAVGNGTHFGGGMNVTPNADPFDGMFDVCLIRKVGIFKFLTLLPVFIKGKHEKVTSIVTTFRTNELTVKSSRAYPINFDGELELSTPVHYRMLKGALNILVPSEVTA